MRSLAILAAACLLAPVAATPAPAGSSATPVVSSPAMVHTQEDAVRARTAPLTLSGPTRVTSGTTFRLSGMTVVRGLRGDRRHRAVRLEELTGSGWRVAARTRTRVDGRFGFRLAAGDRVRTRAFRARTTAVGPLPGAVTGRLRTRVVAAPTPPASGGVIPGASTYDAAEALPTDYTPPGSGTDWAFLFSGSGSRWDPCTVIHWSYNPTGERYAALPDVKRAFAKIAGVSGLHFQYVGTTPWVYLGSTAGFPTSTDMVVGWADAAALGDLAGSVVGVGGGEATSVTGKDVAYRMTRGYLTLDKDPDTSLPAGFDGMGWGQIMTHEVLHALGLGHAAGDTQVMFGTASARNYRFGAGDITGMGRIGAPAGCLS